MWGMSVSKISNDQVMESCVKMVKSGVSVHVVVILRNYICVRMIML